MDDDPTTNIIINFRFPRAIMAVLIVLIIIVLIYLTFNRELDGLALGDEDASMLGYPVNKIRKIAIILISLLTAVIVAKTGIIGFVGLVVPHIARKICGYSHKCLIPVSLVIGSFLLLWVDNISRILIRPEEDANRCYYSFHRGSVLLMDNEAERKRL